MKHFFLSLFALLLGLSVSAQENLVFNGDFQLHNTRQPIAWVFNPFAEFHLEGGPGNKPFLRLISNGSKIYENKVRQYSLTMVPGASYKLSAWIRTKDFASSNSSIVLTNEGWYADAGLKNFPANTDWKYLETTFVCPKSEHLNQYGFVCLATGHTGLLDIADIKLTALAPEAAKASAPTASVTALYLPRLVPMAPSLDAVPVSKPQVTFQCFGRQGFAAKPGDYVLKAIEAASQFTSPAVPVVLNQDLSLSLAGLAPGWHHLNCQIVSRKDGQVSLELPLWVQLRDIPAPAEVTIPKRLNNLSREYCNSAFRKNQAFEFVIDHPSWFFIAARKTPASFAVTLDGKTVITEQTERTECFRLLDIGRHSVQANEACLLQIRSIAETLGCAMVEGPRMNTFPKYDWNFVKKWAGPAITHFNRGYITPQVLQDCHNMGRLWTMSFDANKIASPEDGLQRLSKYFKGLTSDGLTADEFAFSQSYLDNWSNSLKTFDDYEGKLLYTWANIPPQLPGVHTDFIASCLNASRAQGKILSEVYMRTLGSETEAKNFIDASLIGPFQATRGFYPDLARRFGIILGNFNQIGVISLEHHPDVDYKYFLDMQMHALATNPVFDGLGTVGYWGYHYTDEEMFRWSSRLLRHYVVEGNTEMLSKEYGFSYQPGHIRNLDFDGSLEHWDVKAATPDAVTLGQQADYSRAIQNRWPEASFGNTFCIFRKTPDAASSISQKASNLVPGKKYMLLFCTADLDDVRAKRLNPRELGLKASLENAEIVVNMVWVDKRERGNYAYNHNIARMNVNRIIFTPKATEMTLTFSNQTAKDGEQLILNYIQLKPFYDFLP